MGSASIATRAKPGERHSHAATAGAAGSRSERPLSMRPLFVGIVRGLAGSAAIALLVLTTIQDVVRALLYLGVFGGGTIAGMALLTLLVVVPVADRRGRNACLLASCNLFARDQHQRVPVSNMKISRCSEVVRRFPWLSALPAVIALAACGGDPGDGDADDGADPANSAPQAPMLPGTGIPNTPGNGTPTNGNEGNPSVGSLTPSGGGATPPIGAPSNPPPTSGNSDTQTPPPPSPEPAPPSSSLEPIIPAPSGACPDFRSGTQTILGLSTEIVAGAPGATQGPLLFTWHGTGGTGRQALMQLPESVQRDITSRGGIVIAPSDNGRVRAGQDVTFVLGVWYDGADLAFADQIVACAVQNHNIDPRQIYVTGCSAGGLMAGVMSMQRSSYVAAAAPNSGGITSPLVTLEDPERIPAVMTLHGGAGDNVIVNFGDTSRQLIAKLSPLGAFMVDCNHNSGHCGAPASLHENAWEFMKAHPFGTQPSPYASGLPGDFPSFCAIQ